MLIADSDLRDLLINPRATRSGQYVADCPFCSKEQHFYISRRTQLFDCKRCQEHGSIYKLLRHLDKLYLLGGSAVEDKEQIISIREMISGVGGGNTAEPIRGELPVVKMPVGWRILTEGSCYLRDRGVSPADCRRYNIGATAMFQKYRNYVLIPVYDGGRVRGFVGRYAAAKVPRDRLRYNNSVGTQFASLLFGYDEISSGTVTVVLVEGIFDKIAVDKALCLDSGVEIKCACTFGKKISDNQIRKLMSKGVRNVILLYDFDAVREIKRYGMELENYFVTGITFTSAKKDIDECSVGEVWEVFNGLRRPREFNEDVIGKIKR